MVSDTERVWIDYQDATQGDLICEHRHGQLLVERVIVPVLELPSAAYTVIRVTVSTDPDVRGHVLTSDGSGYWSNSGHTLGPASMDRRVQAFEVLSEPRAVTAKAVLRRVVSGGITTSEDEDSELRTIAREFGVES